MFYLPFFYSLISFIFGASIAFVIFKIRSGNLEERNTRLQALHKLDEIMMSSYVDLSEVAQRVTDAIAFEIKFELGVLALIDQKNGILKRMAMSRTKTGDQAKKVLPFPYEQLDIPLTDPHNLMIQAIKDDQVKVTHNLYDVFVPVLDQKISAEIQKTVGVNTSLIYPVKARGKVIGVMIISLSREQENLKSYESETIKDLIDVVGIALDNAMLYQNSKSISEQLKQANIKLQDLDKLKDDFVSIASHELRTPMTAIRSYSWMALNRSDIPLSVKMKKYLERTLISTERLINLVNDMLNVSRIESGRIEISPAALDLQSLVADALGEVEIKASEKGIKLNTLYQNIPQVFADSDKVHQVLLNLIGNALKFTPKSGTITISFFSDGHSVETSVKDSGVGISQEDISKLFQKFGRLDSSYTAAATTGGTGLGLYICKSLIEKMGGKIGARSDGEGQGSTFYFSLPVATKELLNNPAFKVSPNPKAIPLEPVSI